MGRRRAGIMLHEVHEITKISGTDWTSDRTTPKKADSTRHGTRNKLL